MKRLSIITRSINLAGNPGKITGHGTFASSGGRASGLSSQPRSMQDVKDALKEMWSNLIGS